MWTWIQLVLMGIFGGILGYSFSLKDWQFWTMLILFLTFGLVNFIEGLEKSQ